MISGAVFYFTNFFFSLMSVLFAIFWIIVMRLSVSIACLLSLVSHAALDIGVRAQALGGAIRAEGSSNDTIFYNPAAIIKERRISPEIDYAYYGLIKTHSFGASVVDAKTSSWAMGLAYHGDFFPKNTLSSVHRLHAAIAVPLGTDMVALGGSVSYLYNSNSIGTDSYHHFFNTDVGLLINTPIGLSLAVVADNLINPKGAEKGLGLSIGSAFDFSSILKVPLLVSFDWTMDDVKSDAKLGHILSGGFQFTILAVAPIRIGFKSDLERDEKYLSLGAGLNGGPVSIEGLYRQDVSLGKNRLFGVALRVGI